MLVRGRWNRDSWYPVKWGLFIMFLVGGLHFIRWEQSKSSRRGRHGETDDIKVKKKTGKRWGEDTGEKVRTRRKGVRRDGEGRQSGDIGGRRRCKNSGMNLEKQRCMAGEQRGGKSEKEVRSIDSPSGMHLCPSILIRTCLQPMAAWQRQHRNHDWIHHRT